LAEEPHRVLFAIQVQPGHQDKLLGLFLLEHGVTVAVPCRRQRLGPVLLQELLQHFLPAVFSHDVFIELCPAAAEQFLQRRQHYRLRNSSRAVQRRVQNLLSGNGRFFKHARQRGPARIFQNRRRE